MKVNEQIKAPTTPAGRVMMILTVLVFVVQAYLIARQLLIGFCGKNNCTGTLDSLLELTDTVRTLLK
jgi:hypothetical protein